VTISRYVLARPEVVRKDKKLIQIFVNRRKIYDYSLVQAVEYGYSGYVPGKDNPVAFVFIDIDPGLVDFNVHPAKRECRIRIMADLHKALVMLVKGFASRFSISLQSDKPLFESPGGTLKPEMSRLEGFDSASKVYVPDAVESRFIAKQTEDAYGFDREPGSLDNRDTDPCRYIGQAFDLFLIVEKGDSIYLIDQHAAHERILFDQFRKERPTTQELLFPIAFEATQEEKASIESLSGSFRDLGIVLDATGSDMYEITALPAHLVSTDQDELVRIIKCSIGTFDEISDSINAMAACRNAIKEGEKIDGVTALNLIRRTFNLENARCPHGRPIWFTMTKDKLYNILGRK
jgi:DNA mismatch repair protein MutL